MGILRSRLALVALLAVLGQVGPASGWYVVLAHPHEQAGAMECTCEGDAHDPMCPMHRSPNAMRGDAACHLDAASAVPLPNLGLAALLPRPADAVARPSGAPAPAPARHAEARALPVDLPPPRA